jgi:hypothetical protein
MIKFIISAILVFKSFYLKPYTNSFYNLISSRNI